MFWTLTSIDWTIITGRPPIQAEEEKIALEQVVGEV